MTKKKYIQLKLESGELINCDNIEFISVETKTRPDYVVLSHSNYIALKEQLEQLTRFLINYSSEVRSPITAMKGYTDLLLLEVNGELSDEQRKFVGIIRENAIYIQSLLNETIHKYSE
ncbi:MAG: histidine kinase dimerization/phospho-acceptor domain-containing protein [Chloroflexota bacterium]